MVNMIRSHQAAASAMPMTFRPSPSAFLAEGEPGRSATTRFFAPESRRFSAWAWPWRAIAEDGDLLVLDQVHIAVAVVVNAHGVLHLVLMARQ
jgi:hypothetical protein